VGFGDFVLMVFVHYFKVPNLSFIFVFLENPLPVMNSSKIFCARKSFSFFLQCCSELGKVGSEASFSISTQLSSKAVVVSLVLD
jgi:hypothetical protein